MKTLYYRNYLKYCNYRCSYCPFPKDELSKLKIIRDQKYLAQFVAFIKQSSSEYRLFFVPRGEILGFTHFQTALIQLSKLPNVHELVVQTNLSGSLEWLAEGNLQKIIFWTTYHPQQVNLGSFMRQIEQLLEYNLKFSIGVVGVKENYQSIAGIAERLSALAVKPYLWINAYKDQPNYYRAEEVNFLKQLDPLFELNLTNYRTSQAACRTGQQVWFVEYNGNLHRCWQDRKIVGNLYQDSLADLSLDLFCHQRECGCYIGYIHLVALQLEQIYQTSLLGRIP